MNKTNKIIKFREDVEGYNMPVLNERAMRASAGILAKPYHLFGIFGAEKLNDK